MNKTVNINLANVLFHIDEGAYNSMRLYLESVKRSFANTPGSDEILADIEARIAELFQEKLENERQVITQKEVDEVITIMGQPEDYMVDEEIFEDAPKASFSKNKSVKKLYRDIEMKYVAGVSSGLAHYVGIKSIWVRIAFIVFTFLSGGSFLFIYGLLWILIPEATTTSQKLDMRGEDINISNIERKVKEGFDDVTKKVKNVDYSEVGNKVKTGSKNIFDSLGDIIMFFFKVFGKFIGIILILIGAVTIIGMFISMLTVGTLDWINVPGIDGLIDNVTEVPVWLLSIKCFFVIGIPFFFLLYLGLKILVKNLKSIGNIAKFSLLGLWLISLIALIVLIAREAASHAFTASVSTEDVFALENETDTLNIQLLTSELFDQRAHMSLNDLRMVYNNEGEEVLLSDNVRFQIKKSQDSDFKVSVRKEADGPSYDEARKIAEKINYSYEFSGNTLMLNSFLTANENSKFKDQDTRVYLYVPVGTNIKYDGSSERLWTIRADTDRSSRNFEKYIWQMGNDGELKCQNCPEIEVNVENSDDEGENKINIDENGIDININEDGESFKVKINENGVDLQSKDENGNNPDNVDIKINEEGVKIKTNDNNTP